MRNKNSASLKQVAIPVSCHEAPLLATMWKNCTQQILDNLPWMTKRKKNLTFCNQLTSTYTSLDSTSPNLSNVYHPHSKPGHLQALTWWTPISNVQVLRCAPVWVPHVSHVSQAWPEWASGFRCSSAAPPWWLIFAIFANSTTRCNMCFWAPDPRSCCSTPSTGGVPSKPERMTKSREADFWGSFR